MSNGDPAPLGSCLGLEDGTNLLYHPNPVSPLKPPNYRELIRTSRHQTSWSLGEGTYSFPPTSNLSFPLPVRFVTTVSLSFHPSSTESGVKRRNLGGGGLTRWVSLNSLKFFKIISNNLSTIPVDPTFLVFFFSVYIYFGG